MLDPNPVSLPSPTAPPTPHTRAHTGPRALRWGLALLLLVLVVAAAVLLGRVALPGWQAYRAATALRAHAAGGLTPDKAALLQADIEQADRAVQQMAAGLPPLRPLLRGLRWLPDYGNTVAAGPELMALGGALSALGAEVAPLLEPALAEQENLARAVALADALADDPARIERMAAYAVDAQAAYYRLPIDTLHPRLAGPLEPAGPLFDVLPTLMKALPGLPVLLGNNEPRTYLVLVQNNHEMRATGGFITAVGRVTLDKGRLVEMDFQDVYAIFQETSEYPPIPAPMEEYMKIPYMTFRDSNWSPDLPTTVAIARSIYSMDTGLDFDDVVTIDLNGVQVLMDALSPLQLEGVDEPLTGSNIVDLMKELWARPPDSDVAIDKVLGEWWAERKNFIPMVAQAALDKVLSGGADYMALGAAAVRALDQRDIQLYVDDPIVAPVLAELGWDGALRPPATDDDGEAMDYLALVDTNMGYNKANAVIDQSLAYTVTWPRTPGAAAMAEATITYTHTYTGAPTLCVPEATYRLVDGERVTTYDEMVHRCYFDYVRLYTPRGSELLEMTGVEEESVSSQRGEKGTRVFAGYVSLEPGDVKRVTFRYTLPETIVPEEYTLRIQRQSGSDALPVTLHVGGVEERFLLSDGLIEWRNEQP